MAPGLVGQDRRTTSHEPSSFSHPIPPHTRQAWICRLTADDFQPFAEVAAEAGLAAWHEAAVSLTIIPSTEWLILHGEALPADEKLEKVKKWLDVNEGKKDAHPVIVRFAHEYLCNKPREAELRAKEDSFAMNTETVNMSLKSQGQK